MKDEQFDREKMFNKGLYEAAQDYERRRKEDISALRQGESSLRSEVAHWRREVRKIQQIQNDQAKAHQAQMNKATKERSALRQQLSDIQQTDKPLATESATEVQQDTGTRPASRLERVRALKAQILKDAPYLGENTTPRPASAWSALPAASGAAPGTANPVFGAPSPRMGKFGPGSPIPAQGMAGSGSRPLKSGLSGSKLGNLQLPGFGEVQSKTDVPPPPKPAPKSAPGEAFGALFGRPRSNPPAGSTSSVQTSFSAGSNRSPLGTDYLAGVNPFDLDDGAAPSTNPFQGYGGSQSRF
ncbi:hypothetical protein BDZ85DRAFT_40710 [Elsinoe ampelina]|uniref:Uncharacterized protein n=1 Tax=Elsinoe ampelina TaxID=302913 RepID=A0A6A6G2C4_9PEZI|nr:hypothetical protein BDZ85DRAFT_40710 [Elsinoe ampelina]